MATRTVTHRDSWGHEREGYTEDRVISYAPAKPAASSCGVAWTWLEERIGAVGCIGGVIWATQRAISHVADKNAFWDKAGPLEISAISLLIWLHAKWRRSVKLR